MVALLGGGGFELGAPVDDVRAGALVDRLVLGDGLVFGVLGEVLVEGDGLEYTVVPLECFWLVRVGGGKGLGE